jgi:hypothetical protein
MKNYEIKNWDSSGKNDYIYITCTRCKGEFVDYYMPNYITYNYCPFCSFKLEDENVEN